MPPYHQTPLPFTETARIRSSLSSSQVSSTNSAQTPLPPSESSPRATNRCRRLRVETRRRMTMMMIFQTWLLVRTSRTRSNKWSKKHFGSEGSGVWWGICYIVEYFLDGESGREELWVTPKFGLGNRGRCFWKESLCDWPCRRTNEW